MTGSTPTFSTPTQTEDGFTVTITNYDPAYTYTFAATAGTVVVGANGVVTITGLEPGASATLTATATQAGHAIESATVTGGGTQDRHGADGDDPGLDQRRVHLRHPELRPGLDLHRTATERRHGGDRRQRPRDGHRAGAGRIDHGHDHRAQGRPDRHPDRRHRIRPPLRRPPTPPPTTDRAAAGRRRGHRRRRGGRFDPHPDRHQRRPQGRRRADDGNLGHGRRQAGHAVGDAHHHGGVEGPPARHGRTASRPAAPPPCGASRPRPCSRS